MKILLYGNGWIGSQIIKQFKNNNIISIVIGKSRINIDNDVIEEVKMINPDRIICCVGKTHSNNIKNIDCLEGNLNENIRDNMYSHINLAFICEKLNIHLTIISTGCIYNGYPNNGYKENDIPNFIGSSYSIVKIYTEKILKKFNNILIVRFRLPLSYSHPRNLIDKLIKYDLIDNKQNSITILPSMLPILVDMIEKKYIGVFNMTNPGMISHNEILEMYQKYVNPNIKWKNGKIKLKSKRANCFLNTDKLESIYDVMNVKDAVKKLFVNYNK